MCENRYERDCLSWWHLLGASIFSGGLWAFIIWLLWS